MSIFRHLTIILGVTLLVAGCKTKQSPPAMPPSSSPPTSSSPPSSSPPSQQSRRSQPSQPSDTQKKSSPTSSPSSQPSPMPQPQQQPQVASVPSMPDPTRSPAGSPGQQDSQESKRGDSGETGQEQREKAAETLKKSGQDIAESGQEIGQSGEPPELPQMAEQRPGEGEWDPLMPETDQVSQSDSETFEESTEASASSSAQAEAQQSSESSGQPDDMMEPQQESGNPASGGSPEYASEEMEALQKALEEAGIALQTAGEQLETATTEAELAEAEKALARARLKVIVAGQDLADLREIFETQPNLLPPELAEEELARSEEALNEANVAIVIATESIFSSRIELPDFNPNLPGGGLPGRESELDKELNESIAIFEGKILDARNDVIGSTPPPKTNEEIPGVAVLGGTGSDDPGDGTFEENAEVEPAMPDVIQQGRMPEGAEVASAEQGSQVLIPEDVPDPQGDDIVAQQLRELAIAETDPELREKLWEEYKRYKAGL